MNSGEAWMIGLSLLGVDLFCLAINCTGLFDRPTLHNIPERVTHSGSRKDD